MTLDFTFWDEWRGSLDGRPTMWISRLFKLPFWLLAEIVAAKVRQDRISALENMGPDELLK